MSLDRATTADRTFPFPSTPRETVEALVGLDTTSHLGNVPAIELLRDVLQARGATTHIFREDDGRDANLVAVFPAAGEARLGPEVSTDRRSSEVLGESYGVGRGGVDRLEGEPARPDAGADRRGILIAGHADCVPVTGQAWDSPPFEPVERDGRLYGRGTCDMKSYLAVFAALADRFVAAELSEPVYFAVTWDEETSCNGARELVKQLEALEVRPRIAYVGEPTMMDVITAHKSMNSFEVQFRGIAAHSSLLPRGLNALRYAAEFTTWFHEEIIDRGVAEGPHDEAFPVPHITGGVNRLDGGIAVNTVPAFASLQCEFRALPQVDAVAIARRIQAKVEEIDARMRAAVPSDPADEEQAREVGASLRTSTLLYPLDAGVDGPAVRLARELGVEVSPTKVTYGTESGIYEAAGMSAVVIGPGDIAQAHGANEFVSLEQLARCEAFFLALLARVGSEGADGAA
ncbi:MAG: M20/M25/M40 family metallo-hydrolase [Dermabacter sp.]|nr:M20/M25/M40 family metallo-hydrolase [Dermabacter sp.]